MTPSPGIGVRIAAEEAGVEPEYITDNGRDGDARLVLWSVDGCEMIDTNADPIGEDDEGFAELRAQLNAKSAEKRNADRIDGYDRDDLGESPDY